MGAGGRLSLIDQLVVKITLLNELVVKIIYWSVGGKG